MPGFLIAVDGPAASGKGTVSAMLGRLYDYPVLDTGLLYRAVGAAVRAVGGSLDDAAQAGEAAAALDVKRLEDPALRTREAGEAASRVAVHPEVRDALLAFQRRFAARMPGAVMDGRDIGTVICPSATAKLYVDAQLDIRARRRWAELKAMGIRRAEQDVVQELGARDAADKSRPISPLKQAPDADLLDTSDLGIDAAFAAALALVSPKVESALKDRHRG
jgi:cytidylate kinase